MPAKRLDRLADTGISMYRKDNRGIASVRNARHRAANAGNPAVEAFAAVARHQNHSPAHEMRRQNGSAPGTQVGPVIQQSGNSQQSIDPGIAGDEDPVATDPFPLQILSRPCGRRKVKIGDVGYEPSVHFFGPGRINVVRAQAGLDVSNGYAVIEGGKRPGKGRGRVTLHDHPIGPKGIENLTNSG